MTASKIVAAAASSVGGGITDVDDVFSTFLYDGASNLVITNGIDLAGKGGLVWGKGRSNVDGHWLVDSERGKGSNNNFKYLRSEGSQAEQDISNRSLSSFNSNGFTFQGADAQFNASGQEYVTWTFRKAPKFFDIQTWTGNGVNGRTISHNLGSTPGMIIVKKTNAVESWPVYHRGLHASDPEDYAMFLNLTGGKSTETYWNNTAPTNTGFTVSSNSKLNSNAQSYIAYIFAHNDSGDGEFGPDSDQDIIKCGSYTGNGSSTGPVINLGFEPQWLMIKNAESSYNWICVDVMRGWSAAPSANTLFWNQTNAEDPAGTRVEPTNSGFKIITSSFDYNKNTDPFIYMAIRRGGMQTPTAASDVFGMQDYTGTSGSGAGPKGPITGFVTDFALFKNRPESVTESFITQTRLTGREYLLPSNENAGATLSNGAFDRMDGAADTGLNGYNIWGWKRALGYFDVALWNGTAVARTISHNLGVVPEMIWVKNRESSERWAVYHKGLNGGTDPEDYYLQLNMTNAEANGADWWNDTAPTSSVFTVGTQGQVNGEYADHIAYLFATVAGVSKVGSYTGNGSSQNIDCGFSSGARFVLIKNRAGGTNWMVFDSVRGIVSGNDPYLRLNTTAAEVTNTDYIDPYSGGFAVTGVENDINASGDTFIFYAVA
jgi:hypothetical protein